MPEDAIAPFDEAIFTAVDALVDLAWPQPTFDIEHDIEEIGRDPPAIGQPVIACERFEGFECRLQQPMPVPGGQGLEQQPNQIAHLVYGGTRLKRIRNG